MNVNNFYTRATCLKKWIQNFFLKSYFLYFGNDISVGALLLFANIWYLCVDHVIWTVCVITNLVLNFECLFWFFSADIKIRSERSTNHSYKGALTQKR